MDKITDITSLILTSISFFVLKPFCLKRMVIFEDKSIFLQNKQFLFVSNHVGYGDPFVIATSLPYTWLIKQLPLKILAKPLNYKGDWIMQLLHYTHFTYIVYYLFNVVVFRNDRDAKEKLLPFQHYLQSGYGGLIFPEGSMSFNGRLSEIKKGISILRTEIQSKPFVFVYLYRRPRKFVLDLYRPYKVIFSTVSVSQHENYQDFVKNEFERLHKKLLNVH